MYSFVFKSKLKKLNPDLFVSDADTRGVASLCNRRGKRAKALTAAQLQYASKEQREFIEASDSGWLPETICGVPASWIPEGDEFDIESGRLLKRGWRSVLDILIKRGLTTRAKAEKVFGASLTNTYDRMNQDSKLEFERARAGFETAQQKLKRFI